MIVIIPPGRAKVSGEKLEEPNTSNGETSGVRENKAEKLRENFVNSGSEVEGSLNVRNGQLQVADVILVLNECRISGFSCR